MASAEQISEWLLHSNDHCQDVKYTLFKSSEMERTVSFLFLFCAEKSCSYSRLSWTELQRPSATHPTVFSLPSGFASLGLPVFSTHCSTPQQCHSLRNLFLSVVSFLPHWIPLADSQNGFSSLLASLGQRDHAHEVICHPPARMVQWCIYQPHFPILF